MLAVGVLWAVLIALWFRPEWVLAVLAILGLIVMSAMLFFEVANL